MINPYIQQQFYPDPCKVRGSGSRARECTRIRVHPSWALAHQMAPFDDGTTWVVDNNDPWTLMNTAHGARLVLEEPGRAAYPEAPAMAALAVEGPQIQFIARGCASSLHGAWARGYGRLWRLWKHSTFPTRSSTLDNFSSCPWCLPVRQSTVAFGTTSHTSCYSQWKSGDYFHEPLVLGSWCSSLRIAWLDSG